MMRRNLTPQRALLLMAATVAALFVLAYLDLSTPWFAFVVVALATALVPLSVWTSRDRLPDRTWPALLVASVAAWAAVLAAALMPGETNIGAGALLGLGLLGLLSIPLAAAARLG